MQQHNQPPDVGSWIVCEVAGQRFTGQVKAHGRVKGKRAYQVQADLPQGAPILAVQANQIVHVF